jgi:hypothetical protein
LLRKGLRVICEAALTFALIIRSRFTEATLTEDVAAPLPCASVLARDGCLPAVLGEMWEQLD